MGPDQWKPRLATADDVDEVARLLHDFNLEFDTPTPGPEAIAARLRTLLGDGTDQTLAFVAGAPAVAVALVTLRPNVWYPGPVALLDELYTVPHLRSHGIGSAIVDLFLTTVRERGVQLVEINVDEGDVDAQRFYERHGFSRRDPDTNDQAFYYLQELEPPRQDPPGDR